MKNKEDIGKIFDKAVMDSLIAVQPPLDRDKLVDNELMANIEEGSEENISLDMTLNSSQKA